MSETWPNPSSVEKSDQQSLDGTQSPKKLVQPKMDNSCHSLSDLFIERVVMGWTDTSRGGMGQLGEELSLCFTPPIVITVASVRLWGGNFLSFPRVWVSAIWVFFNCFLILFWEQVIFKRVSTADHFTSQLSHFRFYTNPFSASFFQMNKILLNLFLIKIVHLFWGDPSSYQTLRLAYLVYVTITTLRITTPGLAS